MVRAGASSGIQRLDRVKRTLDDVPLTTDAMLLAADPDDPLIVATKNLGHRPWESIT